MEGPLRDGANIGQRRSALLQMPSGQVPVAEIGGRIIADSAAIARALEERYPDKPLLPSPGTPERAEADALNRLERVLFSKWMQWLTSSRWVKGFSSLPSHLLCLGYKELRVSAFEPVSPQPTPPLPPLLPLIFFSFPSRFSQ